MDRYLFKKLEQKNYMNAHFEQQKSRISEDSILKTQVN